MDFNLVQRKKALFGFYSDTDEDKGLDHSTFRVCSGGILFADEAGPAGKVELGAFVLKFHEYVNI